VPGVTSLTACAGASGRPLAGRNDVLTVLPATLPDALLERRLKETDAAAIMKVGRHLGRVRALLERQSLLDKAVYVAHASRDGEQVLPLAGFSTAEAPYFSMILVSRGTA
jgi:precorrin-2/cobalt-factor-2 C20-methyltransferase